MKIDMCYDINIFEVVKRLADGDWNGVRKYVLENCIKDADEREAFAHACVDISYDYFDDETLQMVHNYVTLVGGRKLNPLYVAEDDVRNAAWDAMNYMESDIIARDGNEPNGIMMYVPFTVRLIRPHKSVVACGRDREKAFEF